jgi:hypothetical protein
MRYTTYVAVILLFLALRAHAVSDSSRTEEPVVYLNNETFYSTALVDALNEEQLSVAINDGFQPLPATDPALQLKRDSVAGAMQRMDLSGTYADQVPDKIDMLPIGIRKVVGNLDWTLMLTNMTVGQDGAYISAYLRVITPQGKTLLLGAEGVKLNSDGGISDMKLVLLGAFEVPMGKYRLVLQGGTMNTNTGLAANPMTYAIVGCQGLKLLNLVGYFEISNDLVIPVDPNTLKAQTDVNQSVTAPFAISIQNWNDLVVQLSLPSFEMKGLSGVAFNVRNAVLDMSDTRNAPVMIFPTGYQDKYYPGNSLLWRGVYIEELDVILPQQFAKKSTGIRPSFTGRCMIIDGQGVSGIYSVQADLLTLDEGNASSWKFSVSQVTIGLEANRLTAGGFAGKIALPITDKNDGSNVLGYSALIDDKDEYFLTVKLTDSLKFDFLMAHVTLLPNSYVTLSIVQSSGDASQRVFKPLAVLTGSISLSASNSAAGGKLGASGLNFQELRLMTDAPYFSITGVQYNGQIQFSNFPVSLNNIGIKQMSLDGKDCIALSFDLRVNIEENKINGGANIILAAYYDQSSPGATDGHWKFYKVKIGEIDLSAQFSSLTVAGKIIFFDGDPIYGNAFYGSIMIKYADKFMIQSSAMFGAKDFRYWYIDARIDLPVPITVVGPFMLGGFGGGAYSKMSLAPAGSQLPYAPDATSSFGVKALVMYVIAKKQLCYGDLMFEIDFNTTGGVKYIAFYGSAEIVAAGGALGGITQKLSSVPASTLKATSAADSDKIASGNVQDVAKSTNTGSQPASNIFAYIGINYNFETSTLEANSEIFINMGILKGIGPNARAGWMEVHLSPGVWYCYAGTPQDRLGISLSIAGMQLSTGSYFMAGSQMPTFPDPPQEVMRILGPDLYPQQNNISTASLQTGTGFAFGMDLSLSANIDFMILYMNMQAGVGGDVMLRQYPDAHCQGSSADLGINQWYANGRVYTYLEGEIGVKVDLMFIHARIPIINGAAAAMLEGGGPNPTWATGYLRVRFSVLGGKISGDMNMKMSLGDQCVIVNNTQAPVSYKIISDISPADNSTETDVFTYPQIAFNVGVEDPFEINDDNGSRTFRVKINTLTLTSGGNQLTFKQAFTNNKQTLTLTPDNTLPPQSTIQLAVQVSFEEYTNNSWNAYKVNGTTPVEAQTVSFKTGAAPTDIPYRNISYMYPAHQQKNVYKDENKTGYVVLKQWQDYLLDADTKDNQIARLTPSGGTNQPVELPVKLDRGNKKITFDVSSLQNQTSYKFELISRPKVTSTPSSTSTTSSYGDTTSGQYSITDNKAATIVQNGGDKVLLTCSYSTSQYPTLVAKLNDISSSTGNSIVYLLNYDYLNVRTKSYEIFDSTELFGSDFTGDQPLISYQSLLTDSYYQNTVLPTIYKNYPYAGIIIKDRDVNEFGFPPAKALYHDPEYELDPARMPYIDGLVDVYRKDFNDIENQMINQYVNGNLSLYKTYPQFFRSFPEAPLRNTEHIEFKYVMPGSATGTSGVINYNRQ